MPIALYMQLWRTTRSDWNCYTGYFLWDQNIISPFKPKILGIIWPWNQHFNLKNQRNWKKQVWMLSFLIGIICILLHWWKKVTLVGEVGCLESEFFKNSVVICFCRHEEVIFVIRLDVTRILLSSRPRNSLSIPIGKVADPDFASWYEIVFDFKGAILFSCT